jgi:hypothetical protein
VREKGGKFGKVFKLTDAVATAPSQSGAKNITAAMMRLFFAKARCFALFSMTS